MSIIDNVYYTTIIHDIQEIIPSEITKSNDIESILLDKIKNKLGNRCSKEGYIKKESIKIIDRSIGKIISSHLNGNIVYNLKLEVDICKPLEGNVFECKVLGLNKMGIMCKKEPMLIALSKIYHDDCIDLFNKIKIDDIIKIEVIASRYEFNDNEINVIGKLKI